MSNAHTVVGIGEILWDILPSSRRLGGAPANFAYCSHLLGENAVVASRVGNDLFGQEIRDRLKRVGIGDQFVQTDPLHSTGTVQVQLDDVGQPTFEIVQPVAWDFLVLEPGWQRLAKEADAVCFGSLAQRAESRKTILQFLDSTRANALRVFDVNLRQEFYSAEIVSQLLQRANVLKLNHEEVPRVKQLLAMNDKSDAAFCRSLINRFELKLVCITRGALGSLLSNGAEVHEHAGFRVKVKDTIGAGDAFTAALVHGLMQGYSLKEINESANRLGAWVATHSGAMPELPLGGIEQALAEIQ
jgi:fructokinase